MKLNTSIAPRRTGVVLASHAGVTYEFRPGADGELECDVADQAAVAALLATGNFYPASEEDFESAMALARSAARANQGDEDDDNEDGAPVLDAPPVEAAAPVQPTRKRAGARKAN